MKKALTLKEIKSYGSGKNSKIYAKKGEILDLIDQSTNVYIVENPKTKIRFSVSKSDAKILD
jgi:hypothetical protein